MKRIAIVYSSQNGSTQKVAQRIGELFRKEGHNVDIFDTKNSNRINPDDYSFIGIGCPVYAFRPSYEILDYLDKLENLKDKKVFTFITYGSDIGDGANWLRKRIKKMGAIDVGHVSITGKNLFPQYTKRGYIFSPEGPTVDELNATESFVENILLNIDSDNLINPPKYDQKTKFIGRFERFAFNRLFIKHFYYRFLSVNEKRCTSCNICIKNCPTKSISRDSKNRLAWGGNCILCAKCEISCTQKAISTPYSWFIFAPFLIYNIKNAVKRKVVHRTTPERVDTETQRGE